MSFRRVTVVPVLLLALLAGCATTQRRPFPPPTPGWEGAARMELVWRYRVAAVEGTRKVRFVVLLPQTMPRRQAVAGLQFDPEPTRLYERGRDHYAEYVLQGPPEETTLTVRAFVELLRPDLETSALRAVPAADGAEGDWTSPEEHVESDDPLIQAAARSVEGSETPRVVRGLLAWVTHHMRYGGFQSKELGARGALDEGRGDCTDYADLFVALCRARSIPARVAKGIVTEFGEDTSKHSWAEAWLGPALGWVAFDPLWIDLGKATTDTMKAVYLTLSYTRNDPELDGYHDWVYWYWGGKAKVTETLDVLVPGPTDGARVAGRTGAGGAGRVLVARVTRPSPDTCAPPTAAGSTSSSSSGAGSPPRSTLPSPACGR